MRGVLEAKISEAKFEAKLEFSGGTPWGCKWGKYGYFLELDIEMRTSYTLYKQYREVKANKKPASPLQAISKKFKGKEKASEGKSGAATTAKVNQSGDKGKVPAKKNAKTTVETKKPSTNSSSKGTGNAKGTSNGQGRKKSVQVSAG